MDLRELLQQRILTLDGAMGTQLLAQGARGALELCNVENPLLVAAVHEEYLKAGADIITTNTTCADALCLEAHGLQKRSYELSLAGARIAREAADKYSTADKPRYVAGSVGPTSRNLTLANDVQREDVAAAYADVVRGLLDGGVDMILIETVTDAANAAVAVEEVRRQSADIPIILSAVLARMEGRVASGATIAKFLEQIPLAEIAVVGFNCTNGVKPLEVALKTLAAECSKPIIAYPSVGQPQLPMSRYVKEMEQLCRAGMLNVVGGCCGTTPAHIAGLAKAAARWRGHKFEKRTDK